jgi:hypothetical protein
MSVAVDRVMETLGVRDAYQSFTKLTKRQVCSVAAALFRNLIH